MDGLQNLEQYQQMNDTGNIDDIMQPAQSEHDFIFPESCESIGHQDHFDNCENVQASDAELKAYEAPE